MGDENSHSEKIWRDGEMSVIAGAIMSVVFDNQDRPEYQNLTNVYMFISDVSLSTPYARTPSAHSSSAR